MLKSVLLNQSQKQDYFLVLSFPNVNLEAINLSSEMQ